MQMMQQQAIKGAAVNACADQMLDVNERLNSIVGEGGEVLIAILVKKKKNNIGKCHRRKRYV
jgi:hypothetical protein